MPDEAPRLGAHHLAVAEQGDQRGTCVHAETVRSTANSASSTAAPRTSPVTPPRRVVMKRAPATLVSPATTTAPRPPTPSTATEAPTAHPSATATARRATSAL